MKIIIAYLILSIISLTGLLGLLVTDDVNLPFSIMYMKTLLACSFIGGIGGCIYCLRAVYLRACVLKDWDNSWKIWYYLRPIVSVYSGGISYLFLKAGLLILESSSALETSNVGFFAFAFIAGLNVDNFMNRVEDIAKTTWGIEKSRTVKKIEKGNS